MNDNDMSNASIYYELYLFNYLLQNEYITDEEYNRIVRSCATESGRFFVSKVINLSF